ncbi:MAG: beta-lactamase family protein [Bacteroidia bacterium]|nr:beta-lactamase family protein [Bacteroidia bacterium]
MKSYQYLVFVIHFVLWLLPQSAIGQESYKQSIDSIFQEYSTNTPGIAISIVHKDDIIYSKGFGSAQLEYRIPIGERTVFHIASDSKRFTALSILLLEKEGKLSLSEPIHQYLPDLYDFGFPITIRHLLNHTSGLRDQWQLLGMAGWNIEDIVTQEHILKLVYQQKELNFKPNDAFTYCNTGYTLLAEIVEKVSGESFEEFTKTHIFQPLGMNDTHFHSNHKHIVPNRAYSYNQKEDEEFEKEILNFANMGATGLFTTARDLQKWLVNVMSDDPKVGDKNIFSTMQQNAVLNNGEETFYGMGEMSFPYNGKQIIGHGGTDAGFNSFVGYFPEYQIGIIGLSNYGNISAGNLVLQAADIYMQQKGISQNSEPVDVPSPTSTEERQFIDPDEKAMEKQVGVYETVWGNVFVKEINGDLHFKNVGDDAEFQLFNAETTTQYYNEEEQYTMVFSDLENEEYHALKITGPNNTNFSAIRIYPVFYSSDDLKEFEGAYHSDELSTTYEIVLDEDSLVAKHARHADIPLQLKSRDRFTGEQWYFDILEFIRNEEGEIVEVLISGGRGRVKDIRFKRLKND